MEDAARRAYQRHGLGDFEIGKVEARPLGSGLPFWGVMVRTIDGSERSLEIDVAEALAEDLTIAGEKNATRLAWECRLARDKMRLP